MIRPTILLAEPDDALAASLRFTLELQGYAVLAIQPADLQGACLDLLGPACLVLGERPRSGDMLDLAVALKGAACPIPIIVLTTNPSRATVERARNCGALLIEKPLLGETLGDALRKLFDARNAA
jgi:DNA-binding response OmpR family regulator